MASTTSERAPAPPLAIDDARLPQMADALRVLAMDAVERANSGHPGMPMGFAEAATALATQHLLVDPTAPDWPDRDRLVLSAGHGSMLLYALHHLFGYADMTVEALKNFRQLGAVTAGHPEYGLALGVETTTGPLGQGLANAVGMALAEARLAARFGAGLVDHRTYAIVGDGCLMEGISQEAIALAGHLKLRKLIVLWDDNEVTIDGGLALSDSTDQLARAAAAGWKATRVDGHDPRAVAEAIDAAKTSDAPSLIACRTVIGRGAPGKQGTAAAHGAPLGPEEAALARATLGWPHEPFETPADIREAWRAVADRGAAARADWERRREASSERAAFDAAIAGDVAPRVDAAIRAHKKELSAEPPKVATRKASAMALEALNPAVPELVGGSADLSGSNNTRTKGLETLSAENYAGRYLHYGVREHAMAAAMNGMALHGGVVPYGGTFLVFTDYMRPAMRLAALMGLRVVFVCTHDSIGVGEDGPTHQPVEHLAALRAIPNLEVFRPADAVETAECWALALARADGPSVIALTRQGLAPARTDYDEDNRCADGAYVLDTAENPDVTLVASGSEVEIARAARGLLAERGLSARVVSAPSFERFAARDRVAREALLGGAPRVGVEAAVRQGWDLFLRPGDAFVGMDGFGASGPGAALYEHFGVTPERVAETAAALATQEKHA